MRSGTIESKVDSTEDFRRWRLAPPGPDDPDVRIVGAISERTCEALAGLRHEPRTLATTVSRRDIGHALRDSKQKRGRAISEAEMDRLPEILAAPDAVLFELHRGKPTLIYVFAALGGEAGKFVVQMARNGKAANRLVTAGYVSWENLRTGPYGGLQVESTGVILATGRQGTSQRVEWRRCA